MITIDNLIIWLNTPTVIAFNTLFGIVGFLLTVFVALKTGSISKELERSKAARKYNRSRKTYSDKFQGHCDSITIDKLCDRHLVTSILTDVKKYKNSFLPVFGLLDHWTIFCLKHHLQKEHSKINFDKVCIHLTEIIGRLTKEEQTK